MPANLGAKGAMFTIDLASATGLMEVQLEQAIGELVALGLVTADTFSPLRWLIRPESQKRRVARAMRRRVGRPDTPMLGRWSVASSLAASTDQANSAPLFPDQARLAVVCEALLRRYGVVFRAVIERESLLPPWRRLLRYLRRMEDRGEVHGGRFVDGFSGEQFALPEAVGLLRRHEARSDGGGLQVISAADPLNLGGIISPGVKTAVRPGSRILLRDGIPVARIQSDEVELLGHDTGMSRSEAERHLRVVRALPGALGR
jgi:ATP-dependent Lhr-like helicase